MKKIFFLCMLCIFVGDVFAQTYLIPHFDFTYLRIRGGRMVDKWYMASRGEWDAGAGIGIDVRHHFKKFYVQAGLTHSENMPSVYFINTYIYKLQLGYEQEYGGTTPHFLRIQMPISIGSTLKRYSVGKISVNIRGLVGLMPVYRFQSEGEVTIKYSEGSEEYKELRQYLAVNKIVAMYRPLELHTMVGVGLDMGPFMVDAKRSIALTDLAHDIEFESKTYPFSWRGDQLTISVGWKFRADKNRTRKQKREKRSYF